MVIGLKSLKILVLFPPHLCFWDISFTASSTIGWIDSGGIAAAAKTLGIPNLRVFRISPFAHVFTLIHGKRCVQAPFGKPTFGIRNHYWRFWLVRRISSQVEFFSSLIAAGVMAFSYVVVAGK